MTGLLAEMTWAEVADAVADGATTVVLPLGATEQHGPHLPLGTDTFRAAALAEQLAAALPDATLEVSDVPWIWGARDRLRAVVGGFLAQ